MSDFIYIAAPFRGASKEEVAFNVARAAALGRVAALQGHLPFVPHLCIGGLFEYDDATYREESLKLGIAWLDKLLCSGARAQFWLLEKDEGGRSAGCSEELSYCVKAAPEGRASGLHIWLSREWPQWYGAFKEVGLLDLWESLLMAPPSTPGAQT